MYLSCFQKVAFDLKETEEQRSIKVQDAQPHSSLGGLSQQAHACILIGHRPVERRSL